MKDWENSVVKRQSSGRQWQISVQLREREGIEHVHRNLREGCCDVKEELEDKQVSQPYSRLSDTIRGGEYVDVSSESFWDLCNLDERLRDC